MFQKLFGTDVPHAAWFLIGLVILARIMQQVRSFCIIR